MSIGGPEGGANTKATSPSSSPLRTETTFGIGFLEAATTSLLKAFRGIAADRVVVRLL